MLHQYTDFQKSIKRLNAEESLESRSEPFFLIFWVVVAIFVGEAVYDGYKADQDHQNMSQMVSECANGKTVMLGDAVMKCNVKQVMQ